MNNLFIIVFILGTVNVYSLEYKHQLNSSNFLSLNNEVIAFSNKKITSRIVFINTPFFAERGAPFVMDGRSVYKCDKNTLIKMFDFPKELTHKKAVFLQDVIITYGKGIIHFISHKGELLRQIQDVTKVEVFDEKIVYQKENNIFVLDLNLGSTKAIPVKEKLQIRSFIRLLNGDIVSLLYEEKTDIIDIFKPKKFTLMFLNEERTLYDLTTTEDIIDCVPYQKGIVFLCSEGVYSFEEGVIKHISEDLGSSLFIDDDNQIILFVYSEIINECYEHVQILQTGLPRAYIKKIRFEPESKSEVIFMISSKFRSIREGNELLFYTVEDGDFDLIKVNLDQRRQEHIFKEFDLGIEEQVEELDDDKAVNEIDENEIMTSLSQTDEPVPDREK